MAFLYHYYIVLASCTYHISTLHVIMCTSKVHTHTSIFLLLFIIMLQGVIIGLLLSFRNRNSYKHLMVLSTLHYKYTIYTPRNIHMYMTSLLCVIYKERKRGKLTKNKCTVNFCIVRCFYKFHANLTQSSYYKWSLYSSVCICICIG